MTDLQDIFDDDESGLLETPVKAAPVTANDRLQRSFLEIVEFRREHGRQPRSDIREIAERKLGARLDGIRANPQKLEALRSLDEFGLLDDPEAPTSLDDLFDSDDDLLSDRTGLLDTSDLPARAARTEPVVVAQRQKSADFASFEPMFRQKHAELADGTAKLVRYGGLRQIVDGAFFVIAGVMAFVADVHDSEPSAAGQQKQRLRCIFENGTESSMYRQSLSTRLYEEGGQAVLPSGYDTLLADDELTGNLYVLRSLSTDPQIAEMQDLFKIGFSTGSVYARIAHAEREPTYLMAPVEVVANYRTYNLKTSALEHLLHRVFAVARLRMTQTARDGRSVEPSEWFQVPLHSIDSAIELIQSGEIVDYEYDSTRRTLVRLSKTGN